MGSENSDGLRAFIISMDDALKPKPSFGICSWCGNFFTSGVGYGTGPYFCSHAHDKAFQGQAGALEMTSAIIEQQLGPKGEELASKGPYPDWLEWAIDNQGKR